MHSQLAGTRYLQLIHARYFRAMTAAAVLDRAVDELVASGAAARSGARIVNVD
jgi:hypothetical protein